MKIKNFSYQKASWKSASSSVFYVSKNIIFEHKRNSVDLSFIQLDRVLMMMLDLVMVV